MTLRCFQELGEDQIYLEIYFGHLNGQIDISYKSLYCEGPLKILLPLKKTNKIVGIQVFRTLEISEELVTIQGMLL